MAAQNAEAEAKEQQEKAQQAVTTTTSGEDEPDTGNQAVESEKRQGNKQRVEKQ